MKPPAFLGYRFHEAVGSPVQARSDIPVRDRLARQRTELANERTLLAYTRTALGFVIVGVPAVWWLEQPGLQAAGVASLLIGILFLAVGVHRFFAVKADIDAQQD